MLSPVCALDALGQKYPNSLVRMQTSYKSEFYVFILDYSEKHNEVHQFAIRFRKEDFKIFPNQGALNNFVLENFRQFTQGLEPKCINIS